MMALNVKSIDCQSFKGHPDRSIDSLILGVKGQAYTFMVAEDGVNAVICSQPLFTDKATKGFTNPPQK